MSTLLHAQGLLFLLSALAVASGTSEIERQRQTIARLAALQGQDLAAKASAVLRGYDAGSAAYYTFHSTWDPPAPAAFLAESGLALTATGSMPDCS